MYLEMCASLNSSPTEEETPPDFSDLSIQSQDVLEIYAHLKDDWTGMGGYAGKEFGTLRMLLDIYEIPKTDWLLYFELLRVVILEQTSYINNKIKSESRAKTGGKTNPKRG